MKKTVIHELNDFGQSTWLDYISRSLISSGKLKEFIDSGVSGITSNPSIFNKAISATSDYDDKISKLSYEKKSAFEIYDSLTIEDIKNAADAFWPVFETTQGKDGYVSLEINPKLSGNTQESIEEGRRLFGSVNRPNVMIKVPATEAGYKIIEELISQGVNVNATLIFSLNQYRNTVWAYLKGMDRLSAKQDDLGGVCSVASVFVSRIDTLIDNMLYEKILKEENHDKKIKIESFLGRSAVENSKLIFEKFNKMFSSDLFKSLKDKNAKVQRVLWASTSTKNSDYSDIKYVSELIIKPTVNTMPEKTLSAFLDHGKVKEAFNLDSIKDSQAFFIELAEFGIDINAVCEKLLIDGIVSFEKAFTDLLNSIDSKAQALCAQS